MKFLYLILGVLLPFTSAFVIPDEEVLTGLNKEDDTTLNHHPWYYPHVVTKPNRNPKTTSAHPPKPTTKPPQCEPPCFLNIYEELSRRRSTTKFASLVKQDKTLVNILNTVSLDHTVFAPTDRAFDEFPGNLSSFSKEDLRALVLYHVSPGLVFVDDLLEAGGGTVPTLLNQSVLGADGLAQRLDFRVDAEGDEEVVLGHKSEGRVVTGDIVCSFFPFFSLLYTIETNPCNVKPATNGLLHLIDSLLLPPPPTVAILNSLPTEFSTLTLALIKTGLYRTLSQLPNTTTPNTGHLNRTTLFIPPNTAFESLPEEITEFLFSSQEGTKYLRALLEYHIVVNYTLFSDVLYTDEGEVVEFKDGEGVTVELPTLLRGGNCSVVVDVGGGDDDWNGGDGDDDGDDDDEIEMKTKPDRVKGELITVDGVDITAMDSVTRYGVMHVIDRILIPGGWDEGEEAKLTVEELKERLESCVKDGDGKTRNILDVEHLDL